MDGRVVHACVESLHTSALSLFIPPLSWNKRHLTGGGLSLVDRVNFYEDVHTRFHHPLTRTSPNESLPWKQEDTKDEPERLFLRLLRLASS